LVSIIINCHNGEKYLNSCIQSILNQKYYNFEIVFWDNCSSDKSEQIIKDYKDKRIKYHKSTEILSLGQARNEAIKVSNGELVTFLDVDDWYKPEKLEIQVEEFINDKDIGLVFTNYLYFNDINKKKKIGTTTSQEKFFINFINKKESLPQVLLDDYNIGILTVMIKKELFKKTNFNEKFSFIEDFDLIFRLSFLTRFKYIAKPLAYYRTHENNLSKLKLNDYIGELENWKKDISKEIEFELDFKKFDSKIKFMEIKNDIITGKKFDAFKKILTSSSYGEKMRKIKYLFLILLPHTLIKKIIKESF